MPLIRGGYILLSRKLIESEIWNKPPLYLKIWVYLLSQAQHQDYKGLKRGQLWTSIPEIQDAMSYKVGFRIEKPSKKQVWSALEWMRGPSARSNTRNPCEQLVNKTTKEPMIETTKGTHGILVNIVNYGLYQDPKNYEGNNEGNNDGTMNGTRREREGNNINKNDKNDKNVQEEYMYASGDAQVRTTKEKEATKDKPRSPFKSKIQEARFDEFWKAHPKKRSKGQAEKAWVKISPDAELFAKMLDGLERAKKSRDWIKDGGQYIPYPSTWLNAKGWEDDYSDIEGRPTSGLSDEDRAYIEESWARQFGEDADV